MRSTADVAGVSRRSSTCWVPPRPSSAVSTGVRAYLLRRSIIVVPPSVCPRGAPGLRGLERQDVGPLGRGVLGVHRGQVAAVAVVLVEGPAHPLVGPGPSPD